MLQTCVVGNIGVLICSYVIPTMQTRSSNNLKDWILQIIQSDTVQKLLRWYGFQPNQSATTTVIRKRLSLSKWYNICFWTWYRHKYRIDNKAHDTLDENSQCDKLVGKSCRVSYQTIFVSSTSTLHCKLH